MSEVFKNFSLALTTGDQVAYTCPAGVTAVIIGGQVVNIDGADGAAATVWWNNGTANVPLLYQSVVVAGEAKGYVAGKIILTEGQAIGGKGSANGDLMVSGFLMEMS